MRLDKLTTKFQEALADAQSLALGNDHAYIEPMHVLAAMQLSEKAGEMQIFGAEIAGVFNMGGLGVANYVSILERTR